jgi:hypothetical protein
MSRYTQLQDTAAKLIDKFGMDATIVRRTGGIFQIRVVVSDYLPHQKDGEHIQWVDRKVIMAPNGIIVPDPQIDRLVLANETQSLQIVNVVKVSPGGEDIVYELQVRP